MQFSCIHVNVEWKTISRRYHQFQSLFIISRDNIIVSCSCIKWNYLSTSEDVIKQSILDTLTQTDAVRHVKSMLKFTKFFTLQATIKHDNYLFMFIHVYTYYDLFPLNTCLEKRSVREIKKVSLYGFCRIESQLLVIIQLLHKENIPSWKLYRFKLFFITRIFLVDRVTVQLLNMIY